MNNIPLERQISQAVSYLVVEGNLAAYENELTLIVTAIFGRNCGLVCKTTLPSSHLAQTPHNPDNRPIMHIGLLGRKQPLEIIWSMLHEYGHVLQGSAALKEVELDKSLEYPREKDAWDKAEIELVKYPRLVANISEFYDYRDFALNTYEK